MQETFSNMLKWRIVIFQWIYMHKGECIWTLVTFLFVNYLRKSEQKNLKEGK